MLGWRTSIVMCTGAVIDGLTKAYNSPVSTQVGRVHLLPRADQPLIYASPTTCCTPVVAPGRFFPLLQADRNLRRNAGVRLPRFFFDIHWLPIEDTRTQPWFQVYRLSRWRAKHCSSLGRQSELLIWYMSGKELCLMRPLHATPLGKLAFFCFARE